MNLTKPCPDSLINEWTDVELDLIDPTEKITLRSHRIILARHSEFFRKMFIFNRSTTKFSVKVPNAPIANLIIKSMYNINTEVNGPNWLLTLETIRCCQYLMIEYDSIEKLATIRVPNDAFDLLVEVLSHYDLSKENVLARTLRNNLPTEFDTERLPKQWLNHDNQYLIMTEGPISIDLIDLQSLKLVKKISKPNLNVISTVSKDGQFFVMGSKNVNGAHLKILNIMKNEWHELITDRLFTVSQIVISNNNELIAIAYNVMYYNNIVIIKVANIDSKPIGMIIKNINIETTKISFIDFVDDNKKIIAVYQFRAYVVDVETGKYFCIVNNWADSIRYSIILPNREILWCDYDTIQISNFEGKLIGKECMADGIKCLGIIPFANPGNIQYKIVYLYSHFGSDIYSINTLDINTGKSMSLAKFQNEINGFKITPDGKRMVTYQDKKIQLWNVENGELIHTLTLTSDIDNDNNDFENILII